MIQAYTRALEQRPWLALVVIIVFLLGIVALIRSISINDRKGSNTYGIILAAVVLLFIVFVWLFGLFGHL